MSQSGYFEVKAVPDCVVCKTRGFNELALITSVIPGDILSFTMYWTIILLQSPTESPDQVT